MGISRFNETLSHKKVEVLILQAHTTWCSHLKIDKECDVSKKYDLSNHAKAPVKGRNKFTISIITSFHGRFSVLSALMTLFKLKIYNYSHRHYCKSIICHDSMVNIVIPVNCFVILHSALVHCGALS